MNPILLEIPMPITTPRMLLRHPLPGDGAELNAAILETQDALFPWMPWSRERPTLDQSEENVRVAYSKWILREDLRISAFDRVSGKMIGSSGLHRMNWEMRSFEIGYWTRKSFMGKGYAQEFANAITRFGFLQLKANRVEIRCNAKNETSITVIKKLGFELEGRLRNSDWQVTDEVGCRDTLVFSRVNIDALPPLEVQW